MGQFNPYKPPEGRVADPTVAPSHRPLARRFPRLLARILDNLIYFAPVIALFGAIDFEDPDSTGDLQLAVAGGWVLIVFVINLVLLARDGQSLGKKALKVKIVRHDGSQADLGRIFALRMLAPGALGAIPYVGGVFSLVNVLLIFREDRRCIHDFMADTSVVDVAPSASSVVTDWSNA